MENIRNNKIVGFVLWVILCLGIGSVSIVYTTPAIENWYPTLVKPVFNPPDWIFGPVWTILYILMGIAAYLIWTRDTNNKNIREALYIFIVQLLLNFCWSLIFFECHHLWWAFIEIILLWITILWTTVVFWRILKPAAYLIIPYLVWVTFAGVLNLAVAILN